VYATHKIKVAGATLTVGLLLVVAFAGPGQASSTTPKGLTAQELQAVQARSEAWNRFYRLGKTQELQALQARSDAWNRYYDLGAYSTSGRTAEELRSQAMNRYYHLGADSLAVQTAEKRRAQELNRYYHVGQYAVIRVPSRFVWSDAGIGAGTMLGVLLVGGGLAVAVRRRITGKTSFQSTT